MTRLFLEDAEAACTAAKLLLLVIDSIVSLNYSELVHIVTSCSK